MSFVYHRVGTALADEFTYLDDATRLPVTGKVQGDFTFELSKNTTSGESTVGITLTAIGNGKYSINATAAAFPAATGMYVLRVTDTASPRYSFQSIYIVTSDGTGAGTTGTASFTAVAGNGRITSASAALSDATVYIVTPAGVLYVQTTSTAAGTWGPIYFATDGTYTVYAQKAGYTTTSGTIVVSGATATGPGADLALTAVSSGASLSLGELMAYARRQAHDRVGTKSDADIKSAINDALSMCAKQQHRFSWLKTDGVVAFSGYYSTGTITISGTTVTLTGGTWPSWAASGKLQLNGKFYRITTRTSATVLVLTDTYSDTPAITAAGYVIFRDEYTLPSNCLKFSQIIPGEQWGWGAVPVPFETLRQFQGNLLTSQSFPACFAVFSNKVAVWPYPDLDREYPIIYYRMPATLVNTTDVADWDPLHLEVLQRAIDYQLAIRFGDVVAGTAEACEKRFTTSNARAIDYDKTSEVRVSPLSQGGRFRSTIADRRLPSS